MMGFYEQSDIKSLFVLFIRADFENL